MTKITRRDAIRTGATLLAAPAILTYSLRSEAQELALEAEKGATLRVLRPSKFVQGDENLWLANTEKFSKQFGIPVKVESEGWEDLRPKSAVAANVGRGPDIVYGWHDDAHQYPEKLANLSDVATYLDKKYGGFYDVCKKYGMRRGQWISVPLGAAGSKMVYRASWLKEAGHTAFPKDLPGFLKVCQDLKRINKPAGMALGNAVGDANGWCHWIVWAHGGRMVDDKDRVVINSAETIKALDYVRELYQTFVPGTLSWLDPSNNKAFLDGQLSLTNNGISVYYAAKNSTDATVKAMAEDIQHADYPVGPVGKPTELNLIVNAMLFRYSKFPKAAKKYIAFMMEKEQYEPWQEASIGYFSQPLREYEKSKIWTSDPKHTPYRGTLSNMLWSGYGGSPGYASAAVLADFIMVNMVAAAASGAKSSRDAAAEAQKRAERYYKI
ncbi:MAG: extracellular solute-binding protein [Alphaproteobacteria bacterium]|nr:extracellular solute-binding protein [Alphaproteobacteria bacterium]